MKKVESEMADELRPEYDLRSLPVRKVGPERKSFGGPTVRLEPDVAEAEARGEVVCRLLINVLRSDPEPLVRHEVAFVLGRVGGQKQVMAVRAALERDPSFLVRHEAAMALAEIGGPAEVPLLRKKLSDRSREVAISCYVALVHLSERTVAAQSHGKAAVRSGPNLASPNLRCSRPP